MDEVTHAKYCELLNWEDWCSNLEPEETEAFNLCPYVCQHPSHTTTTNTAAGEEGSNDAPPPSYCLLPLWHEPLDPNAAVPQGMPIGTISKQGHLFNCYHGAPSLAQHVTFLVDRSYSMADKGAKPEMPWIKNQPDLDNCQGAVWEAVHIYLSKRARTGVGNDRASLLCFNQDAISMFEVSHMKVN